MYKHIVLLMLGLMYAAPVFAVTVWTEGNCNNNNGGVLSVVGDTTFCKSTRSMNWWSAYSWCQAMGGHLPSVAEFCPGGQYRR